MATINNVRLDRPVEFSGYRLEGNTLEDNTDYVDAHFVENCIYTMSPQDIQNFISELRERDNLQLIEESLQGLWLKEDGTPTKSSMPNLSDLKAAMSETNSFPKEFIELVSQWEKLGVNDITITFEEK